MSSKPGKKGPQGPRASPKLKLETIEDVQNFYDEKIKELQNSYEEKIKLMEVRVQAQVDTLHKIIDKREDVIAKLNEDIGDLKRSLDFMSKETSEMKEQIKNNDDGLKTKLQQNVSDMENIRFKTIDLEDRSRRSNLVFFNFKEESNISTEDCEEKVENLLKSLNILNGEDIWIDRAHRLGKYKEENETKPRPIIVKFSYYKQKEKIIKNGIKFKHCPINVSEDYSKDTLQTHSKLYNYGKEAKEKFIDDKLGIKYHKVTYRRLVLTYTTDKNKTDAKTFTKSFSLKDIQSNNKWFVPPKHNTVRQHE